MDYGRTARPVKPLSKEARMRSREPSCEKCRHLTTESGSAACRMGQGELVLCEEFKDTSHGRIQLAWEMGR